MNNLYEYYTSKGQALPSVTARAPLAAEAGISGTYTGTAEQNQKLLAYLTKNNVSSPTSADQVKDTPTYVPPSSTVGSTPTAVLDLTAGISGLQKQQADFLKTQSDRYAANQKEIDAARKAESDAMANKSDYLAGRTSNEQLLNDYKTKYGIDTGMEMINEMLPEISALRDQLNQLNTKKATAIENTIGQGRGIPTSVLNNQQAKIEREYAIRLNSVSSQLASKSATMESLRGNITLANTLATQAVNAYLYDTEQKVKDYEDLFTYNKDIISNLDSEQKDILNTQYKAVTDELATKRDEQTKVAELMVKYPSAKISVGDSLASAMSKASVAETSANNSKPLDILDVQRYNDLYPDAGVIVGDTVASANEKVKAINTPEARTRALIVSAKDNGNSYEKVVSEINSDATITDKATAIAIVKEVFGFAATPAKNAPKTMADSAGQEISQGGASKPYTASQEIAVNGLWNFLFK